MIQHTYHVMIDIETLSTRMDAAVVSVGMCIFEPTVQIICGATEWATLPEREAHTDFETVRWWTQQTDSARNAAFSIAESGRYTLPEMFNNMDDIIGVNTGRASNECYFWGMPAQFDLGILEYWCKHYGIPTPWHYRKVMCARTLFNLAKIESKDRVQPLIAHRAADDARAQAETVMLAMKKLGIKEF